MDIREHFGKTNLISDTKKAKYEKEYKGELAKLKEATEGYNKSTDSFGRRMYNRQAKEVQTKLKEMRAEYKKQFGGKLPKEK